MKTILLTGATGFLGSHLLEALLKEGYSVVFLKRSTSNTWRINEWLNQAVSYDVDKESLQKIFQEQQIDCVIHLATLYKKVDAGQEISAMLATNVTFPTELIETGIRYGLKAFINTGTFFEYDCSILPVTEEAPKKPFNFYAKTKIAFDMILESYKSNLRIVTLRLFSPYGSKDNDKLIPYLIKKALLNEEVELSDGLQKLDFVYSEDVVKAYLSTLKYREIQEAGYNSFNIGFGSPISIREVVSILEQQLGRNIKKKWGNHSYVDMPIVFSDISKAKDFLEWEPTNSIHDGLNKTVIYYKGYNRS